MIRDIVGAATKSLNLHLSDHKRYPWKILQLPIQPSDGQQKNMEILIKCHINF